MKLFKALLLTLALISVTFHSRESKAAVGAIFGAPVIVTGGLVVAGGAVGLQTVVTALDLLTSPSDVKGTSLWLLFISVPLAAIGLVILDGEQAIQFGPLTKTEAVKLGLSVKELNAYNAELDQLNNLAAYVDAEISKNNKPTLDEAAAVWTEIKDAVSPEAFNALVKVNAPMFK